MRIVVISDSHYDKSSVKLVEKHLKDADVLIHCGDGAPDLDIISKNFSGLVYGVKGNCDISSKFPSERIIDVMGKKIFISHGHFYNVKNEYNTIFYKAKEVGADIALFGHSHKAIISEYDNTIIMNPGSITLPYGGNKKTLGYIEIEEDKTVRASIKEL